MSIVKKGIATVLIAAMAAGLAACGGSGSSSSAPAASTESTESGEAAETAASSGTATYTLKLAHVASENNPYNLGAKKLAELVAEKTNGDVQIDVYPASQLGGEREILEGLQLGTIDMCVVSTAPVANFSDAWYVCDFPYLFTDLETTYEVYDGEIGQELGATVEKDGFKLLVYWQNGFFNIITKDKVVHPEDLKGMTVRCFENPIHSAYFSLCGANAVPAPWGEVYTMLQNGTIDGCTTSYTFIYNTQLNDVAGYVANTHQVYAVAPLMASSLSWANLPAEYQDIIMECAAEARDYERGLCNDSEADQMKELTEKGMDCADVDRDEWADFMIPAMKEQFVGEGKYISEDLYNRIYEITSKGTR